MHGGFNQKLFFSINHSLGLGDLAESLELDYTFNWGEVGAEPKIF